MSYERFLQVEFNGISQLWEVRVDGYKQIEMSTFGAAEAFAHRWCEARPMLEVTMSFNLKGATS